MTVNHIEALRREGQRLADTVEPVGLDSPVPNCPPWTLRDLLAHLGYVHRWANDYVAAARESEIAQLSEAEVLSAQPPDRMLKQWFRDGHAELVGTLEDAPAGLQCWTFLEAPTPVAFWARRQAHETAIHRVDAEVTAGSSITAFEPEFASDGIDELLLGFVARRSARLGGRDDEGPGNILTLVPTDQSVAWDIRVAGRSVSASRRESASGDGDADCTIEGSASDLYRLLWNRADPEELSVLGDPSALESFGQTMRVRWG